MDISACDGHNCSIKNRCKRYLIGQNIIKWGMVGYWVMPMYGLKENDCELFIENNN